MRAFSLSVVGADYPNKRGHGRRFEIALCLPGEPVELRKEPNNPADPRAVAVFSARGVQLGYLTAERAPLIGGWMVQGRQIEIVFQEATRLGALVRIAVDGVPLELPTPSADKPSIQSGDDYDGVDPIYDD